MINHPIYTKFTNKPQLNPTSHKRSSIEAIARIFEAWGMGG